MTFKCFHRHLDVLTAARLESQQGFLDIGYGAGPLLSFSPSPALMTLLTQSSTRLLLGILYTETSNIGLVLGVLQ